MDNLSCSVDLDLSCCHLAESGIMLLQGRRLVLALNFKWSGARRLDDLSKLFRKFPSKEAELSSSAFTTGSPCFPLWNKIKQKKCMIFGTAAFHCLAASSLRVSDSLFTCNGINHVAKWNHLLYTWRLAPGARVGVMIWFWVMVWAVTKLEALFLCFSAIKIGILLYALVQAQNAQEEHVGADGEDFYFLSS